MDSNRPPRTGRSLTHFAATMFGQILSACQYFGDVTVDHRISDQAQSEAVEQTRLYRCRAIVHHAGRELRSRPAEFGLPDAAGELVNALDLIGRPEQLKTRSSRLIRKKTRPGAFAETTRSAER